MKLKNKKIVVSFSGGRTSAYMLKRLLDEGYECVTVFANTGKEREETLVFVEECAKHWSVEITWLEYRRIKTPPELSTKRRSKDSYVIVDFNTASRNGEPFDILISSIGQSKGRNGHCPNARMRFCTDRLKIKVIEAYLKDTLGRNWDDVPVAIGIRADEMHRAKSADIRGSKFYPLIDWGITEKDVNDFWRQQPFDLGLKGYQGNCDLCFLKRKAKLIQILREEPERAKWWIEKEKQTGSFFMMGHLSYQTLLDMALSQREFNFGDDGLGGVSCFCTD